MAHWTKCSHLFKADEYECSHCGNKSDKPYLECPHCGSEMTSYQSYHSYDPRVGLTRWRIMTRCSVTMTTEKQFVRTKKESGRVYLLGSFLFYRRLFFITDQLSVNRSRLYDALAGLVDGRATVSLPTVFLMYLLNNFSLVLPFE